jgi:ribosomal protein S18 acetylase RimI-like enzyme
MDDILHRDAEPGDAAALADLFAETFRETFGHMYQPADLNAFLAGHGVAQWAEQLRDPAIAVRLAERDGRAVGFTKLGSVKLPVEPAGAALEVRQFYVAPEVRGSAVAPALMEWLLHEARARGAEELYLSVYTDNVRAQRFYARYGFVAVGPCVFMVGNQADEDIIMKAPLA